jgi:hypothetical protein
MACSMPDMKNSNDAFFLLTIIDVMVFYWKLRTPSRKSDRLRPVTSPLHGLDK